MNFGLQSLVSDIAAAMFKVASVVSHSALKSELENQAVYLSANPCPDTIFSAENLINLGRETGDIKPINAVVLVRELESLRKGLLTTSVVSEDVKDDLDISPRFAKSHSSNSDTSAKEKGYGNKSVRVPSEGTRTNDSTKTRRPGSGRKNSVNSDKVYQYIVEHKEAKLKELEAAFSEVSGRTVRRMTDALIKAGKIERVGNPGPTSFYRISPNPSFPIISPSSSATSPSSPVIPASSSVIPAQAGIQDSSAISPSLDGNIPQLSYGDAQKVIAL